MNPVTERRLTAAQIILLAADDLVNAGKSEFSEFELTVQAWIRDRNRFGLRGYQQHHPDHKRVMMEIMGQKPHNPIHLKLMEKIRPNFYRLTSPGRAEAARLRQMPSPSPTAGVAPAPAVPKIAARPSSHEDHYESLKDYTSHPAFVSWKDDPEEPRLWSDAAAFFGVRRGKPSDFSERSEEIEKAARLAIDYCDNQELDFLAPSGKTPGKKIPVSDLGQLKDFLQAMKYRFEEHLDSKPKRHAVKT
jgi:hypothetical protein